MVGRDNEATCFSRSGRWRVLQKGIQQELNAKIVDGTTKEDGRHVAGKDGLFIEDFARSIEHIEFFDEGVERLGRHAFAHLWIGDGVEGFGRAIGPADSAFEEVGQLALAVVDASEIGAIAQRPIHSADAELEGVLNLVDQRQWVFRRAIQLVHEGEDGDAPHAANLKQFESLSFDAFGGVDDHDDGIDSHEYAIGIFRKISVTGGVEQVDDEVAIFKLQHGGADGNAALFFQFHPVGGGGALVFAGGDGTRELDGAAVQQQFFGERCFAGVGMRNDGQRTPPGGFLRGAHGTLGMVRGEFMEPAEFSTLWKNCEPFFHTVEKSFPRCGKRGVRRLPLEGAGWSNFFARFTKAEGLG